jgi:hypothetical protein
MSAKNLIQASNECLENTQQEKATPIARLIAWLGRVGGKPPLAPKDLPPSGTSINGRMGGREIHRKILLRVMHNLSEEYYGAGWIVGLEHYLWHMALRQSTEEGQILLYCAETSGGWWMWDDSQGGPLFVPLAVWRTAYNENEMALPI